MKRIAFYLQDGVEILDFGGPLEVFAYAGFEVFTVSKEEGPILSQGILKIQPDYTIKNAPAADILAFFGGNGQKSFQDPVPIEWLKSQKNVAYYFTVCTGAFALAQAGILDGLTATTFHLDLDDMRNRFPKVKVLRNVRFVDNGKVITTAGVSAGIDGALHLVAKLKGFEEARKAAYYMEYDKWHPKEGLILGQEQPYAHFENQEHLVEYCGLFENQDGEVIEVKKNEREGALFAVLKGQVFPLFERGGDQFLHINTKMMHFQRKEGKEISAFLFDGDEKKQYLKKKLLSRKKN